MKFLKIIFFFLFGLYAIYTLSMYFLDDKKTVNLEYIIDYPKDKVYNQFNDLRNFSDWNVFFNVKNDKYKHLQYLSPYQGIGSSLMLINKKDSTNITELFIRKAILNKKIQYDLFNSKNSNPYRIKINFQEINPKKTKIFWQIETPKLSYYNRIQNLFYEDYITDQTNESLKNLNSTLSNKIDLINAENLKTDSIFVENSKTQILLGIEETSLSKKGELYKSISQSHKKVKEFLIRNLEKKEDELGYPVLIFDKNPLDKSLSYFYGISIKNKPKLIDNTFKIKEINSRKQYNIYYKGNYEAHYIAQKKLMLKAKQDSVKYGELTETFYKSPENIQENIMKISLEIIK